MLDLVPSLRKLGYSEDDDNTRVLYFEHGVATFSSLAGKPGWTFEW